jgi:hypothetical protein
MKPKALFILLGVLLLNSCIVKSLFPFYTKDSIKYEPRLVGTWQDDKVTRLEVYPFKEKYLELQGDTPEEAAKSMNRTMLELSGEYRDFGPFGAFEKGYLVVMTEDGKEAVFAAVPFKIKDQTFLDFVLLDVDLSSINSMAANHLLGMHTLIKVGFSEDQSMVSLEWFAEEKLNKLIEENRIRIKYANVGTMTDNPRYLLTAPSEELQRFIAKYMDSRDEDKWSSEIEYNFKKLENGTP